MRNAQTYHVVEIDAGDKETVLRRDLSRAAALRYLDYLRTAFTKDGLRFVMYHDKAEVAR